MKMYLPTGISNYKKLRIEDYYTVDTRCAQKRNTHDPRVFRAEKCGNIDYTTTSFCTEGTHSGKTLDVAMEWKKQ